jgi:soluble lytic murein transglycosylase
VFRRRVAVLTATALALAMVAVMVPARPVGAAPSAAPADDADAEDDGAAPAAPGVGLAVHTPARASRQRTERAPKAVPFDTRWLTPFFATGRARQAMADFRQEKWAVAETGFLKAAAAMPAGSDERGSARYLAALAKANQSKWSEAAALFEVLHRENPTLQPYHAYNASRCRLRAGQPEAALEWAARVPAGTVPEAEAALVRLDALRALGRWRDVADAAAAYLAQFPSGPRRIEALFRRAEALEKAAAESKALELDADLPDITALYRRVWAEGALDPFADRAAERIEAIATALPPSEATLVRTHLAAEWLTRGMTLFDRNRNADAEAAFANALASPGLNADLECRARYHLAQSVWKARQRPRAAPLFDAAEQACRRPESADLHAKSLYQGARSWAAAGDRAAAEARYSRVEAEHAEHSYADDARLRTAELAEEAGESDAAAKILAEIPQRYPKGDLLGEALWRLAFGAWRAERYDEADRWLDENLRRIPREEIWYAEGRALYWKARIAEKKALPEAARALYERAIREYPLSVYGLLSLTRLAATAPRLQTKLVAALRADEQPAPFHFEARPLFGDPGFRRAVALGRMGQGADARRELARLGLATAGEKHGNGNGNGARRGDEDLLWIAAVILDRGGLWSASHTIPHFTLTDYKLHFPAGLGTTKWRLSYPRAFPELVTKNARANQIPEALQLAIMREESAFSPRIESFANAIGLTQMLIKTARRFSMGAPVTREVLMDPVKNLEYGSRFLGFLWTHFAKNAALAIAGYNAGEGAVDRWLNERGQLPLDEFLETIPYDETRNYTKRVLSSYFTYAWLYDPKHPVPALPLTSRVR